MVRGIIFDMDGTMVDNMMVHHRAWQRKLRELGIDLSIEEVQREIHGVNVEILGRLFGDRFTEEERVRISAEKEAEYRKIFLPQLKLIEGLQHFLHSCAQAKIPMAIATAAPVENVDFVLDNLDLRTLFRSAVHAGNVQKGKPDPEVFQRAAAGLSLPPEDCLIFEDSVTGAEAAKRAGSSAVILTTTHQREEFIRFDHIRKFINDFTEITLHEVLS